MVHLYADSLWAPGPDDVDPLVAIYIEMGPFVPPPPALPDELPPKNVRQWLPQIKAGTDGPIHLPTTLDGSNIAFVKRHPAFLAPDFLDLPELVIGRSPRSAHRGRQHRHHSVKMARTLRSCSDLEFEAQRLAEIVPFANYVEQAVVIRYRDARGIKRWHRPDLAVWDGQSVNFTEVKYEDDAAMLEDKWTAIGSSLAEIGFGYEVVTERHLREGRSKQTVDRVFRSRRAIPVPNLAAATMRESHRRGQLSISSLIDAVPGLTFENVLALIQYGVLHLDPRAQLDINSVVEAGRYPLLACERRRGQWRMKIRGVNFDSTVIEIDHDQPEALTILADVPKHAMILGATPEIEIRYATQYRQ